MRLLFTILAIFCAISYARFTSDCLDAHNRYRNALRIPSLNWSSALASSAQRWAEHMAGTRSFRHSKNRHHIGENIATGTARTNTPVDFVNSWAEEREFFIRGRNFPYCSRTGDYHDVGHYTQMIWRKTTQVGCGMATSAGRSYFVCQYSPSGNFRGEPVY